MAALRNVARWQVFKLRRKGKIRIPWVEGLVVVGDRGASDVGRLLYYNGWPEPGEMGFLARLLRPGDTFADVGANVGLFSLLAAAIVGPSGRVEAFEPDPGSFSRLQRNIAENTLRQVTGHRAAVGAQPGSVVLSTGRDAGNRALTAEEIAAGDQGQLVPVVRLDEAVDACMVVKIDAEGYEAKVVSGMSTWWSTGMPWVLTMEFVPRFMERFGDSDTALLRLLQGSGYQLFTYSDTECVLRPLRSKDTPLGTPGVAPTLYVIRDERLEWAFDRLEAGPVSEALRARLSFQRGDSEGGGRRLHR